MASRYTKSIPEFIYFVGDGEWIQGPYVKPQKGYDNRKFKIQEIKEEKKKNPKDEKRFASMEKSFFDDVEKFAKKYPEDIGRLYDSYLKLKEQKKTVFQSSNDDFLSGYLATISDLIIIKKGHWGDRK